jgi:predicted secreted hydrolase
MEMMEKNLARQTGVAMKLQPSQHPKFQEEWVRVQSQLDDQYGRALGQLKELVEQRLTIA